MQIHRYLLLGVFLASAISCSRQADPETVSGPEDATAAETSDASYVPGVLNVEFSDEMAAMIEAGLASGEQIPTKSPQLLGSLQEMGVTSMERIFPDAGEWEPRHRAAGLHRWYRVHYDADSTPCTKAVQTLDELKGVLNAAPQPAIKPTAFFNDPLASVQWNYRSPGPKAGDYAWGADINVEPVWANYTAGSNEVIVSVIDTGMDMTHPDMSSVIIPAGPNGSKCFSYGYEGYDITPENHGTHVAGTIAAINNNRLGVCGIAGGSVGRGGVRILACQIFRTVEGKGDMQGNGEEAMVWSADHGAVICNNSWGTDFNTEIDARAAKEKDYLHTKAAVEYFNQYAGIDKDGRQSGPMKGGVVFFSAGNNAWPAGWPAKLDCVIAVGATTSMNTRTSYSNYGDWVDICTPGGENRGNDIMSCMPDSRYGGMAGTSMACPHASGVAALIVSYFGGPGFTAEMLKEKLLKGASYAKMAPSQNIGPLVDAYASFSLGSVIAPEPVDVLSLNSTTNNVIFDWKVSADPDDKVAGYYLLALATDPADLKAASPDKLPESVRTETASAGGARLGDVLSWEMEGLEFEKDYYAVAFACDACGNYAAASPIAKVTTCANQPPVFDQACPEDITIKAHEIFRYEFKGHDPDGHKFTMSLNPGSAAAKASQFSLNHMEVTLTGRNAAAGSYTGIVTATDQYGCSSDHVFRYTILENHAPELKKDFGNMIFSSVGSSMVLDIGGFAADPDDERLIFRATSENESTVQASLDGNNLTLTAMDNGMTEVTIKATDNLGASCEARFKVLVRESTRDFDLFPNPVTGGVLNIRPGMDATVDVTVSSKSGATVIRKDGIPATPFEPAVLDMSGLSAGVYYVNIKSGGTDTTYPIVKL